MSGRGSLSWGSVQSRNCPVGESVHWVSVSLGTVQSGNCPTINVGPGIYPQIYHTALCPAVLICKGVQQATKEVQDYFKFLKRTDFFIFYNNQVLLGAISQCGPPSCTSQKRPSSLLQFAKRRKYLDTQSKRDLTDSF